MGNVLCGSGDYDPTRERRPLSEEQQKAISDAVAAQQIEHTKKAHSELMGLLRNSMQELKHVEVNSGVHKSIEESVKTTLANQLFKKNTDQTLKDFQSRVNTLFDQLDGDGNGTVDAKEIAAAVKKDPKFKAVLDLTDEDSKDAKSLEAYITSTMNESGQVTRQEFFTSLVLRHGSLMEQWVKDMFSVLDINRDKLVGLNEFTRVVSRSHKFQSILKLRKATLEADIDHTFHLIDADDSGEITLEELTVFMKKNCVTLMLPEDEDEAL